VRELFTNLIRHKYVLANFVARDLKVKYRGTIFGYLWSLLEPLSLVGIYYFVFVVIARRGDHDYPLMVILGVLPYNYLSGVIQGGSIALTSNAPLIRRVYIPREIFVLAQVGSSLIVYALSMLVLVPFLFAYQVTPGWRLLYLPLAVALLTAFSTGVALVTACANAIFRDVAYVLRVVLRLLFYTAPIIYSVEMVPEALRRLYLLNPVAVYVSLARNAVLDRPLPFGLLESLSATAVALVTLLVGALIFSRWEKKAVKYL
jgi:ABC-type polysaccharide/polyol phosphate export permease